MTSTRTSTATHTARPRRARRRCAVGAVAALTLLAAAVAHAAPTGTLDQQQTDTSNTWWGGFGPLFEPRSWAVAQTFTAGLSGVLNQVDLRLKSMEGPATIAIYTVDSTGAPGSTVLASTTVAPVAAEAWVEAAFSSPATVAAGTKYAIVVRSDATGDWLLSESTDPYPAGDSYYSVDAAPWRELDRDHVFKTYVTQAADLSLSIAGPETAKARAQVTYILTVRNKGPQAATNVVLTDHLPYGTQFTSVGTSQGSCTKPGKGASGNVTCNLGTIDSGADSSSGVTLKITARAPQSNINNVATVSSDINDPNLLDNTASFTTQLVK